MILKFLISDYFYTIIIMFRKFLSLDTDYIRCHNEIKIVLIFLVTVILPKTKIFDERSHIILQLFANFFNICLGIVFL